jgi:hypothetical protein
MWMIIISVIPLAQCAPYIEDEVALSEQGKVRVQIALVGDACGVSSGLASVEASDISVTLYTSMAVEDDALVGIMADIPAGANRQLVVQAMNDEDQVVYEGSAEVTVVANQYVEVQLTLERNLTNCPDGSSGGDTEPGLGTVCQTNADCGSGQVCHEGHCGGTRYGACSPALPCQIGLDCVEQGAEHICLEPCESTDVCTLEERCWTPEEAEPLGDGVANHCFYNYCGEGSFWDPDDVVTDAEWMGPCDALGSGDGTCVGPLTSTPLGSAGLCINTGAERVPGWPCDPSAVHGDLSMSCAGGLCIASGICIELCSTDGVDNCQEWSFGGLVTSCSPYAGVTLAESGAGLCMP